ncbi:MAG: hypothetical protein IJF90_10060 [Synergistaceae bacterium]|nr:hypothetical protein [Synergistaceae bacterium]
MSENFVRKDTFEEVMKRIEVMMAASEARNAAQIAEIRGEVKELRAHVEGLENVVLVIADQLNNKSNKLSTLLGVVVAGAAVIVAAVQVFVAVFK